MIPPSFSPPLARAVWIFVLKPNFYRLHEIFASANELGLY